MSGLAGNSRPSTITVHFAGREARNLLAAAVMSALVSAATLVLGIVRGSKLLFIFIIFIFIVMVKEEKYGWRLDVWQRRTFYETAISRYNLSHAVRRVSFACLGSSAGAGVVHDALLDANRTAGAGLAAHSRGTHYADLGSDWIRKDFRRLPRLH